MEPLVPGPVKLLLNDITVSDMTSSMLLIIGAKRVIAKYRVGEMHIAQRKIKCKMTQLFPLQLQPLHSFPMFYASTLFLTNLYKEISSKKNKNVAAIHFSLITCRSF